MIILLIFTGGPMRHLLSAIFLSLALPALLFAAGQPERVVNVYSHRHYDADRDVYDRFTEETGIVVNVVQAGADELIQRLLAEGSASEAGVLQPVETPTLLANVPEHLRDPDGSWYGITKRARVVTYDKTRTSPELIESYADLTRPELEDRVVVRSSSNIYNISLMAAMIAELGPERARAWAEGMTRSFARDPEGNDRDQMKAVVAGIADFALVNTYYIGLL